MRDDLSRLLPKHSTGLLNGFPDPINYSLGSDREGEPENGELDFGIPG